MRNTRASKAAAAAAAMTATAVDIDDTIDTAVASSSSSSSSSSSNIVTPTKPSNTTRLSLTSVSNHSDNKDEDDNDDDDDNHSSTDGHADNMVVGARRRSQRHREPPKRFVVPSSSPTSKKRYSKGSNVESKPTPKRSKTTTTVNTNKPKGKTAVSRSFPPLCMETAGIQSTSSTSTTTKIHTLILGTLPGKESLRNQRYYYNMNNSFWWIAGDCLGFRRDRGLKSDNVNYRDLCQYLRYPDNEKYIMPYEKQVEILCGKGFALWDMIGAANRSTSLDRDIRNAQPNDIRGFVKKHPSIRRIVISGGKSGCEMFEHHFVDWMQSGEIQYHPTEWIAEPSAEWADNSNNSSAAKITLVKAVSTSPACTDHTYQQKRDLWEKHVFEPGLKLHEQESK